MATRIFGPTRSTRRRRFLFVPILLVACAALFYIAGAQAVHDTGRFQLDGDASHLTDPTTPPATDDWDMVCNEYTGHPNQPPTPPGGCGSGGANTTGSTSGSWQSENASLNASIFTGGGSKDPIDISSWKWKDGSVPDKDNLLHAFAVRYSLDPTNIATPGTTNCPNGTGGPGQPAYDPTVKCEVIFFGMDRYDNSGDAQNGFWFLKSNVKNESDGSFSGVHQNGDVLVVSDFSIGGTTSIISVYEWDSTCTAAGKPDSGCADSNLRLEETSTNARCGGAVADPFCGITNPTDGTLAPWAGDYTDKGGNHTYLKGEFYEAGLNLSTLGLAGECFSSMVAESRASTSTSAVLKDFVVSHFPQCKPALTTQASETVGSPVLPGHAVTDRATITVTGGTNPPDPTGDVTFFLCGPIATGDCGTSGGTQVGSPVTLTNAQCSPVSTSDTDGTRCAVSATVNDSTQSGFPRGPLGPGRYCFRVTWPGDTTYPGALNTTNSTTECFAVQETSAITTAQSWLPNDSAHVTLGSGGTPSGTVDFTLYSGAGCTAGNEIHSFTGKTVDSSGNAVTDNSTFAIAVSPGETISWKAVFTPTDTVGTVGSTSTCETSTVTINDNH
jgi:hypothetical protein